MLSTKLKMKISAYYDERVRWMRENNIINLTTPTYKLTFTKHKGYVGQCNYTKKEIRISERHNQFATWESIADTINHELAHWATRGHGHDAVWMQMAVRLGAKPTRCTSVGDLQKPFVIMCRSLVVGYSETYHPPEIAKTRYMKGKKHQTLGNLSYHPNPDYIDNSTWDDSSIVVPTKVKTKVMSKKITDFLSDM